MGSEATKKENPSQISFESFVLDEDDAIAFAIAVATCAFAAFLSSLCLVKSSRERIVHSIE